MYDIYLTEVALFHCSWYCHIKPVSETSLSPKYRQNIVQHVQGKQLPNLRLNVCVSFARQQYWNSSVCWASLDPRLLNGLGNSEGERENPVSVYSKFFGLVVMKVILTMFSQPAEGLISLLSAEFILTSFMEKGNIPDA